MRAIFFISAILLFSCTIRKNETDLRDFNREIGFKSISQISDEFIPTGYLDSLSNYEFVYSIIDFSSLEIQLWKKYNIVHQGRNEIAVFIFKKNAYAIPILPNKYKHYWQFKNDSIDSEHTFLKTTFRKEFNEMLNTLAINDSVLIAYKAQGIFLSYINGSRRIFEPFCRDISNIIFFNKCDSICLIREYDILNSFYDSIIFSGHVYSVYWDERHSRIYQINEDSMFQSKKFHSCLEIYNFNCNCVSNEELLIP